MGGKASAEGGGGGDVRVFQAERLSRAEALGPEPAAHIRRTVQEDEQPEVSRGTGPGLPQGWVGDAP